MRVFSQINNGQQKKQTKQNNNNKTCSIRWIENQELAANLMQYLNFYCILVFSILCSNMSRRVSARQKRQSFILQDYENPNQLVTGDDQCSHV